VRLPAHPAHLSGDAEGSGALHARGDHDQHLHARGEPDTDGLRRADGPHQPRARVLRRSRSPRRVRAGRLRQEQAPGVVADGPRAITVPIMTTLLDTVEIETDRSPQFAVLWMHGLGADGHDFEPIVPEIGLPDGLAVRFVFPHAPMRPVTVNGGAVMRAWYDVTGLGGVRREDEEGVRASQRDIDALIEREKQRGLSASRILLAG